MVEVPAFGTAPNEAVTAAGVALLSLAHQLSAYIQDSNMAAALAFVSKVDAVGKWRGVSPVALGR